MEFIYIYTLVKYSIFAILFGFQCLYLDKLYDIIFESILDRVFENYIILLGWVAGWSLNHPVIGCVVDGFIGCLFD